MREEDEDGRGEGGGEEGGREGGGEGGGGSAPKNLHTAEEDKSGNSEVNEWGAK